MLIWLLGLFKNIWQFPVILFKDFRDKNRNLFVKRSSFLRNGCKNDEIGLQVERKLRKGRSDSSFWREKFLRHSLKMSAKKSCSEKNEKNKNRLFCLAFVPFLKCVEKKIFVRYKKRLNFYWMTIDWLEYLTWF